MSKFAIKHALFTGLAAAAAAVLMAACSSGTSHNSSSGPAGGSGSLATHDVSGIGTVLSDTNGKTLYTAEQEANGTITCTGACLQFWMPVTATSASAPNGVSATIGTTTRSDGAQTQLTYNGAPLYTFAQDAAAGDAKGNDVKDAFGSNHFTWHAVIVTPAASGTTSSATTGGGGGYGGGY